MIYNAAASKTYHRSAPDPSVYRTASDIQTMEDPYRKAKQLRAENDADENDDSED